MKEVKCVTCGEPAAFPEAAVEPWTCYTCGRLAKLKASQETGTQAGSLQQHGSDESALWHEYLRSEGHNDSYKSLCKCYTCQAIRDGFSIWKAKRAERTHPNEKSSNPAAKT